MSYCQEISGTRGENLEEGITADEKIAGPADRKKEKIPPDGAKRHWKSGGPFRWKLCLVVLNMVFLLSVLAILLLWYLKVIPKILTNTHSVLEQGKCTSLRLPLCHKYKVPYAYTVYPNALGHSSQSEASDSIVKYEPLVSVKCSTLLPLLLCSLHAPKCVGEGQMVPPCRSLCEDTVRKCEFFLGVFTVMWPMNMHCDSLPESPDPEICVGLQEMKSLERASQACVGGFRCDQTRCLPNSWACDGYIDCKDSSDEKTCSQCSVEQYYCGHSVCIDKNTVCDGFNDCPDGRDERRCLRLSQNQGQEGEGLLEAYSLVTGDWQPVCGDQWDTTTMSHSACAMLGYRSVNETRLRDESLPPDSRLAVGTSPELRKHMKSLFDRSHKGCEGDSVYVYLKCQNYECGKSANQIIGVPSSRIVGGKESEPGDWPWLVALHGGPEEVFFCGGVLLSEWWVLSAAHCVGNQSDVTGWTLKLGMTRRISHPEFSQKRGLSEIVRHPEFSSVSLYSNDIVLLKMDRPATFDDFLRPSCLPPAELPVSELKSCAVIGWGKPVHDDEAEYQTVVHEVEVPIVNFEDCHKWYSTQEVTISDTMLCAGYEEGKKDACQGDSGGPLLCKADDHWFVAGVVSWGIKCAQPILPGIYTNVPLYVRWIHDTAREYGYPIEELGK